MPEGEQVERRENAAFGEEPAQRRRRRRSHHKGWEYKRSDAKAIRTVLFTALAVVIVVVLWYTLVSRPS